MGLDIDSFLDNVGKEEVPKPEEKEIKKVSLDFQKEVEDRIENVKKDSQNKDIGILKEIYDEVRNFNVDLPNKFLGIENKSGIALKDLSEKYSQEFLTISKNNAQIITKNIKDRILQINEFMQNEDFVNVLENYKIVITDFNFFPKAILNEKIELSRKIRDTEIIIFTKLEEYKNKTIFNLKAQINSKIQSIAELIRTSKLKDAEKGIADLEEFSNHLPKLLLPDLIEEKIKISKVLKKSQDFLIHKYNEEFEYRNNLINQLFEKFHTFYIKKNISETVITYDEIIVEFKTLPDFFVEKKIDIFKQINELYTKLNKLILNRNIFMFVETYEYSKRIEGIREYLKHVEMSNNFDKNNLLEIKRKVSELPKQFIYEKEEFNRKIEELTKNIGQEKVFQEKYETIKKQKEFDKINFQEEKLTNINNPKLNLKGAKKDILIEVDRLYQEFKLTNDSQKVKNIYKKITFYLNLANISPDVKKETLKKLTKTLHEKKLS
jgi:hypothetical protein